VPRSVAVGFLAIAGLLAFTGPGSTQVPSPAPNADGWHNEPFTVTFDRAGMTCDPASTSYSGPDDPTPSPLTSACTDPTGQEPPVILTYSFKYDETRPTADPAPQRGPDANGWYNHPVDVNLNWDAAVSGPDNCPQSLTYSGGTETSSCSDRAGNRNSVDIAFPYDNANPVANPIFQRDPDFNGWYRSPVQVNLNWSDTGSGLDGCPDSLVYSGGTVTSTCHDRAGNQGSVDISRPYDAVPPIARITGGPSGVSTLRTPSFSFAANEESTFQCQLDGGGFSPCTSPWRPATPLGDGEHIFSVSAIDRAGNPGAPVSRRWEVAELPSNTTLPVVVGAAGEAETLSTSLGTWSGGTPPIAYSIRWQRCNASGGNCASIVGATGMEYIVQAADVGSRIRARIRARNIAGDVFANSAPTDVVVALDRSLPQTTIIRQPRNPTNWRTASFTFEASRAGSTFECKLDAGAFGACGSPQVYSALAAGTHTFEVRAVFTARNGERLLEDTPAAAIWTIDVVPPPAPSFVKLRAGDERIALSWIVARVADIRGTRVVRTRVRRPGALVRVLAGSRLTDLGLRNGALYRYVLRTVDKAGNYSGARVVYGRPRDPLLAPRDGAVVFRPPLLRWLARTHATYYNLQLYRVRSGRDVKMLSTWPIRSSYQLRQRWYFGGRRVLRPGLYRWYVWPGFGSFAEARFGRLIGTSVFTKR
jgi:hypothetical protein